MVTRKTFPKIVAPEKGPDTIGFRFTVEDRKLLRAIQNKLGIVSASDVMRQGLRALAAKEGVTA